jgi:hypothetical protein
LFITGAKTRCFVGIPGPPTKLNVEVKPRDVDEQGNVVVFLHKRMELIVSPSDDYNNEILSLQEDGYGPQLITLTARYPDEFSSSDQILGDRVLYGKQNYLVTPVQDREDQSIQAYMRGDVTTLATSNPFRILKHAPGNFALSYPTHGSEIRLEQAAQRTTFQWTESVDPLKKELITTVPVMSGNQNVIITKPDTLKDVDVVKYSVKIRELLSFVMPDSIDTDLVLSATGGTLYNLVGALGGAELDKQTRVGWYVIATDGIWETQSEIREVILTPKGIIDAPVAAFVPDKFALGQNYPNPFNPTTQIQYDVPKASDVKIVVYNILGQPVRTLVNETKDAARYTITWDGKNDNGMPVSTGVYIYKIQAGEFSATKKMNLLK